MWWLACLLRRNLVTEFGPPFWNDLPSPKFDLLDLRETWIFQNFTCSLTWDFSLQNFILTLLKTRVGGLTLVQCWFPACWPWPHHLRHKRSEHWDTGLDLLIFIPDNLLWSGRTPCHRHSANVPRVGVDTAHWSGCSPTAGSPASWEAIHHGKRQHYGLRVRGRE